MVKFPLSLVFSVCLLVTSPPNLQSPSSELDAIHPHALVVLSFNGEIRELLRHDTSWFVPWDDIVLVEILVFVPAFAS